MASVTQEIRNGRTLYRIEYRDKDKRRRKIRLGSISKRDAQAIAVKVQSIVSSTIAGNNDLANATAEWLQQIGDDLHAKLVEQGLCQPRNQSTLGEWLTLYLERHNPRVGSYCQKALGRSQTLLTEFFGTDKQMNDITPIDAQAYRDWLVDDKDMAQATVATHVKKAKQFFSQAIKADIIAKSPFAEVVAGTQANDANSYYVSCEKINKAIEFAPDAQWRLIIALSRYAGLRCPSETLSLKWADVDFVAGTLTINSSKTRKQGKPMRVMPILPELRPYLEDAFDPENERCITRYRVSNSNLRKMFLEILAKAEVEPWPRLFHNLRGSLETDLMNTYPAHVVVAWLGNTEQTALRHYLKVTPQHLADAIANGVGQQVGTSLAETTSSAGNEGKLIPKKLGKLAIPELCEVSQYPREGSNL